MERVVLVGVMMLCLVSAGQSGGFPFAPQAQSEKSVEHALKPGDTMPQLAGQSLTGKPVDLPSGMGDGQIVLIVSFSHSAGRDSQNWGEHLSKDYPHLNIYNAIFLEAAPKLVRPMAVSGIKSGMPPFIQDRAVILYRDESLWKQRLEIKDDSWARVILIDPGGRIRWISPGPFGDAVYQALGKEVQTSK
jgi:hypothetical protein